VVDLDVAIRVLTTIKLVKVEGADCTSPAVYLYSQSSILRLPLVGDVLAKRVPREPLLDGFTARVSLGRQSSPSVLEDVPLEHPLHRGGISLGEVSLL
jgi:hypothetical protein